MSNKRNTCAKCTHYTPADDTSPGNYQFAGKCVLIEDSNDISPRVAEDKVSAWDYESYMAGAYVGPKFGCIHWEKKA
jgi:hypothetical protein